LATPPLPHVVFCLPDFEGLGVQRVVASLARAWPLAEARLSLLVHQRRGPLLTSLPAGVPLLALSELAPDVPKLRVLLRPLLHLRALRRLAPDAVVSFVPGDNLSLLAARKLDRRARWGLVVSEHIHVSSQVRDYRLRFRAPYLALMPRWYPQADAICCLTEAARDDLVANFHIPLNKTVVVPNPLDLAGARAAAREEAGHPWLAQTPLAQRNLPVIVAAGRLEPQKRIDVLLRALAELQAKLPARLLVLGDGPQRASLESLATALGLAERVSFLGFQSNPFAFLARAQAFALSSDYEGFPMVLAEAMALGVPAVATDCPTGPRELLEGGSGGLLVPCGDPVALAAALHQALTDQAGSARRVQVALRAAEQLDAPAIARRYLALSLRVIHRPS
jgi:glycosyltransferase involved in cell wall biosynthesis